MNFKAMCTIFLSLLLCSEAFSKQALVPEVPFVTIYVHGTTTAIGLRLISKFFKDVAFGAPGIHHLSDLPDNALLRSDAALLAKNAPNRFSSDHFYTFGWSGKLSLKARKKAGKELFSDLVTLLAGYHKKYGFYPKVRIMTFSHGGNVALHMLENMPFFKENHVYLELLIVACPVQKMTEKLIEHSDVDRVYTIASTRDLLQVVDRYTFEKKRYFPNRFFDASNQNCSQVQVAIDGRGLGHIDLLRSFMVHIPHVMEVADASLVAQNSVASNQLGSLGGNLKYALPIECNIQDDKFRFFKGFNLIPAVRGKRKK